MKVSVARSKLILAAFSAAAMALASCQTGPGGLSDNPAPGQTSPRNGSPSYVRLPDPLRYRQIVYSPEEDVFLLKTSKAGQFSDVGERTFVFDPSSGSLTAVPSPCPDAKTRTAATLDVQPEQGGSPSRIDARWSTTEEGFSEPDTNVRFLRNGRVAFSCGVAFSPGAFGKLALVQFLIAETQLPHRNGPPTDIFKIVWKSLLQTSFFERTPSGAFITFASLPPESGGALDLLITSASRDHIRWAKGARSVGQFCPPPGGSDDPATCRLVPVGLAPDAGLLTEVYRPVRPASGGPALERTVAYTAFDTSGEVLSIIGSLVTKGNPSQAQLHASFGGWFAFTDSNQDRVREGFNDSALNLWKPSSGISVEYRSPKQGPLANTMAIGAHIGPSHRYFVAQLRSTDADHARHAAIFRMPETSGAVTFADAVKTIRLSGRYGQIAVSRNGDIYEFNDTSIRRIGTLPNR